MHVVKPSFHRIKAATPLPSVAQLSVRVPLTAETAQLVGKCRTEVSDILTGRDDRLLLITGPCSVDHPEAAVEYATRLSRLAAHHCDELLILMRVYVEKPRTRIGWKGLAMDPKIDSTHDINDGLLTSRRVMLRVLETGVPIATEFLDPILAWYLADLVSWGAVGARTAQSQTHRQLVSALGMPIGIKNPTSGRIEDIVDAVAAASAPHVFPALAADGGVIAMSSLGNTDAHVVLRGSDLGPNYAPEDVAQVSRQLSASELNSRLIIDASHGNCGKCHLQQTAVAIELTERIARGENKIAGVMLESYLEEGRQDISAYGTPDHIFGQSITDACISWDATIELLDAFAAAVIERRNTSDNLISVVN